MTMFSQSKMMKTMAVAVALTGGSMLLTGNAQAQPMYTDRSVQVNHTPYGTTRTVTTTRTSYHDGHGQGYGYRPVAYHGGSAYHGGRGYHGSKRCWKTTEWRHGHKVVVRQCRSRY